MQCYNVHEALLLNRGNQGPWVRGSGPWDGAHMANGPCVPK